MTMTETIAAIRRSVSVDAPPERAFRVFTEEMGSWWPLQTHSCFDDPETVTIDGRQGGAITERSRSGEEASWGEVLEWEPPERVLFAWKPNRSPYPPTEVEIRFTAEGGGTLVELEHRGWERLGDRAEEGRASYSGGWPGVLALYQKRVGS
jgi:uncharacterized protein YndB with AHSA1/START domain